MAKYSAELKLHLVQVYESCQLSALEIKEQFGVSSRMLLSWHQRFKYHGVAAFTKKHSYYDAEFKLHVLQYQQQHRLSGHETVAVFNIRGGSGVVSHWRRQYDLGGRRAREPKPKGRPTQMPLLTYQALKKKRLTSLTPKQRRIKELEARLEYLEAENDYLKNSMPYFRKKNRCKKWVVYPRKSANNR